MAVDGPDVTRRLVMQNAEAPCEPVGQVEGRPLVTPAEARVLAYGEHMLVIEVVMPADHGSPQHVHNHESVGYVVRGRVRSTIDGVTHDLGPRDGFRHPKGVAHDMVAVGEEAVWVEIKSPPATTWHPER